MIVFNIMTLSDTYVVSSRPVWVGLGRVDFIYSENEERARGFWRIITKDHEGGVVRQGMWPIRRWLNGSMAQDRRLEGVPCGIHNEPTM
jgi:hypothetical protein